MLHLDFETRAEVDLTEVGTWRYTTHPSTEVLMLGFSFGKQRRLWEPHLGPMPDDLRQALEDPWCPLAAWHSQFERLILWKVLGIPTELDRWVDPMVMARFCSMPGSLEKVANILKTQTRKMDTTGVFTKDDDLKKMFCEPLSMGGELTLFGVEPTTYRDWDTHPREWERFREYCMDDVAAEEEIHEILKEFDLPDWEYEIWRLDQQINDLGMYVDPVLLQGATLVVERARVDLRKKLNDLTQLRNVNSNPQILKFVRQHGYTFGSIGKAYVKRALAGECNLDDVAKDVLHLRSQLSKTAVNKLESCRMALGEDGRIHHILSYYGAARTGRWCLCEGTLIKVQEHGIIKEVPIEKVELHHLLWDGENWVEHDGVVFSGEKEVISWDGVTATTEHLVWVSPEQKISLGEARDKGLSIWRGKGLYKIYKITSPSGRFYIGLTKVSSKNRWRQHVRRALKTAKNHPFYNAIRKYGQENFLVEEIDYAATKEEAQELERFYIAKYPKESLYNLSPGGEADGEYGGNKFWTELNKNPEARETYIKKLSQIKLANDWSDYEALSEANKKWRKDNPKLAWKTSYRSIRTANKSRNLSVDSEKINPQSLQERMSILKETLRRKHKINEIKSEYVTKVWANRTEEEKRFIFDKISKTTKLNSSLEDPEERKERMKGPRSHIDRDKQGRAASKGLKYYWEELRKDPEKYRAYLDRRTETLKQTLKVKYANV